MGNKGHTSEYKILAVLGVVTVVCLLIIALWDSGGDQPDEPSVRSAQIAGRDGLLACREIFERIGIHTDLHEATLAEGDLRQVSVLMLIDPTESLVPLEIQGLDDWVRQGGVLICTNDISPPPECVAGMTAIGYRSYGRSKYSQRQVDPPPTGVSSGCPLARDVSTLTFESAAALDSFPRHGASPPQELLTDAAGIRAAGRQFGKGYVIVLSDSSWLSNGLIGKTDNAVAAANLAALALSKARGDRLAFDEYHFAGVGRPTGWSALADILTTTSPGWAILTASAAGLLLLVHKGRQFGTRRGGGAPRRRSKMEYVRSLGATLRFARANRLSLSLILQSFKSRCAIKVGLGPSASAADLASRLGQLNPPPRSDSRRVLLDCEEAVAGRRRSRGRLESLAEQLGKLESEVLHGRAKGK